jgi:hypothetical protein
MTLLASGSVNKFILQPGETLLLATDAGTTAQYYQASYPPAAQDVPSPTGLALQLHCIGSSESMGDHDSGSDDWWRVG